MASDLERKAIVSKARKLLELAKAERADVLADLERRQAEDHVTIPTLPIRRDELIYKKHEMPPRYEAPAPVTAPSTPTDDWCSYIDGEINAQTRMITEATGDAMRDNNEWLIGKLMDRVEAKEMAIEREIDALKTEIKELREQLQTINNANVKQLRGPSNAA